MRMLKLATAQGEGLFDVNPGIRRGAAACRKNIIMPMEQNAAFLPRQSHALSGQPTPAVACLQHAARGSQLWARSGRTPAPQPKAHSTAKQQTEQVPRINPIQISNRGTHIGRLAGNTEISF